MNAMILLLLIHYLLLLPLCLGVLYLDLDSVLNGLSSFSIILPRRRGLVTLH